MKKLGLIVASLLVIAGCAAGLEDNKGSYSGEGRIVSIVVNEKGDSVIDVQTKDRGHMPIIVTGSVDVFPGQDVRFNRNSRGFGSISAL